MQQKCNGADRCVFFLKTASLSTTALPRLPKRYQREPMRLPKSVQEIAEVIGRERALYLVGKLPRCYVEDRRKRETNKGGMSERVILYVPKTLNPDSQLLKILDWHEASALVDAFGGELLAPGNCGELLRNWRNDGILRAVCNGLSVTLAAEWFDVTPRHVRNVMAAAENPQQAVNDNYRQSAGSNAA